MSAPRNRVIYVDRPPGSAQATDKNDRGITHDTLTASHWRQNPNGSLDVFAYRRGAGEPVLVATYPEGAWTGVQEQRALR